MRQLAGTGEVSGETASRTVSVQHDPAQVGVEEILAALARAGYDATVVD